MNAPPNPLTAGDCCEGLRQRTPLDTGNRPGLSTLAFRVGTHPHFLESLLAGLARAPELNRLRTRERDDPTVALCDAVATLLDVLSFYQERYLSETYLRTATEAFSLHHLARQIAYVPAPAVAAGTYLAFTVEAIPGGVGEIQVPAGTRVQSVPGQNETPQTFETDQTITARVAWNALRPRQTLPYPPLEGAADIYLQGVDTELKVGDRLLFVGPERRTDSGSDEWLLATVHQVDPDRVNGRTHVAFDPPLGPTLATAGFDLYGLGEKAAVYGHNAAEWRTLPETTRKAYLGLAEEDTLPQSAKDQWPHFTISARHANQVGTPEPYPPRIQEATIEKIADTAHKTLQTQGRHSITAVVAGVPDTIGKQVTVFLEGLDALKATGVAAANVASEILGQPVEAVTATFEESLEAIGTAFNDTLAGLGLAGDNVEFETDDGTDEFQAVNDLFTFDWGDPDALKNKVSAVISLISQKIDVTQSAGDLFTGPLAELRTALENLLTTNPVAGLMGAIDSVASDIAFTGAWAHLATAMTNATNALVELPKSVEAAAATQLMAAVVGTATEALRYQKDLLRHRPENLAIGIMVAARITELWIEHNDADFNEWLPPTPLPDEDEEGSHVDLLLEGPIGLLHSILSDLELPSDHLPAELFSSAEITESLVSLIEKIFPSLKALQKGLEPFIQAIDDAADSAKAFLESGLGRGARDTRRYLAQQLAKALKPVTEPGPTPRPFPLKLTDRIDLERLYPKIFAGDDSWAVLGADGSQRLYQVRAVSEAARSDYLLNAKTTRLALEGPDLEALFEDKVRQTTVHAGSRLLEVVEGPLTTPVAGDRIEMTAVEAAEALGLPRKVAISGKTEIADEVCDEIIEVIAATGNGKDTTWYLARGLACRYRRDTVVINANVAPASHGESQVEILGDGDGGRAFQAFTLKQKPLTHLPGRGDSRYESTLSVRIDDIEWQAKPHLLASGPEAAVYTTAIDDEATVTLSFGDGLTGRRLPTGTNNVVANYRKGAGLEGNLRAHQLTTLASRPLGVRAVDNPAPSSGGADAESRAELRQNIPAALLTMGRIVSLGDFQAYAAAYPGIGKAHAAWVWDGIRRRVVVSVIAADGRPIDAAAPLINQLKASMDRVRDIQQPMTVLSGSPVHFRLAARLLIEPTHDVDQVTAAAEKALVATFNFPAARFARGIRRSRVMAAIQAVPGVKAVDLDALARADGLQTAHGDLPAREGAHRGGRLQPAELLVIDPAGITLTRMAVQ